MPSQKRNKQDFAVTVRRLSLSAVGFFLLLGCSNAGSPGQPAASSTEGSGVSIADKINRSRVSVDLLKNAIQVGDDLYMRPQGIDDDGCEMFGAYSKNSPTVTALQYRQPDGTFSIVKDPAVCGVEMVSLGNDEEGCEMYQAKPVTDALEPTPVVYYKDADDRFVPTKPRSSCS